MSNHQPSECAQARTTPTQGPASASFRSRRGGVYVMLVTVFVLSAILGRGGALAEDALRYERLSYAQFVKRVIHSAPGGEVESEGSFRPSCMIR